MQKKFPILPSISELIRQVRNVPFTKYLRFSLWITVDRNIATLFATLPVLMTGIFIAPAGVAFFKLAFGYLNIALSLLGPISILLNVEFPRMKVIGFDQMKRSFIKVSLYSLILTSVLALGVVAISPVAFGILYGPEFRASVPYVFGLFLYGALFGIGVGLGPMWRAVNKVKISILINAITLAAGIPIGFWLIKNYGIWGSVAMVTIWFTVSHMASFIYLTNKLRSI